MNRAVNNRDHKNQKGEAYGSTKGALLNAILNRDISGAIQLGFMGG